MVCKNQVPLCRYRTQKLKWLQRHSLHSFSLFDYVLFFYVNCLIMPQTFNLFSNKVFYIWLDQYSVVSGSLWIRALFYAAICHSFLWQYLFISSQLCLMFLATSVEGALIEIQLTPLIEQYPSTIANENKKLVMLSIWFRLKLFNPSHCSKYLKSLLFAIVCVIVLLIYCMLFCDNACR